MEKYIYIKENSISKELCDIIIEKFNNKNTNVKEGITIGGLNKNVKISLDFCIKKNDCEWDAIQKCLKTELNYNLNMYLKELNDDYKNCNEFQNTTHEYEIMNEERLFDTGFMVKKYLKNEGRYVYHNDFASNTHSNRVLTFIWYLNDVSQGGTTEFFSGKYKIQPKTGNFVLFPASWVFPHCGKMPLSSDKYILTGWIWEKSYC